MIAPTPEFSFVADLPLTRRKRTLLSQVKAFFEETGSGAVPVAVAAHVLEISRGRVHQLIDSGDLRAFKVDKTTLVSLVDVEDRMNSSPVAGRPRKEG